MQSILLAKHARSGGSPGKLPYLLALEYICKCAVRGDCNGWTLHLGMIYNAKVARRLAAGSVHPICPTAEKLLALLNGDKQLVKLAAMLHYALRTAYPPLDPRLLPGYNPIEAANALDALRALNLL
ncbi:hypothetical protein [Pyrolobus fumarii]|uniref:hypothetical protein n=1 Tax=Pyrolobus fumarii TaxID=54252 RepID=UPI00064EB321|nr:hypothetical protein [Pyrolobus fumarii]